MFIPAGRQFSGEPGSEDEPSHITDFSKMTILRQLPELALLRNNTDP